jgi:penicillin-binding protein 2
MAELCRKTGPEVLAKYSRYFGFGRPTGINLYPGERLGLVADPDWKMKNTKEKEWYPLETLHFGIGQGYLTVTPLQLAQLYAAIANSGKVYRPQLVTKITSPSGDTLKKFHPKLTAELKASRNIYSILQQGLSEVVSGGTAAWVFNGFPLDKYPVAGKTGTVQKPPYDNSGVFACYAPTDKPEIVVIVLVEQGGSGSGGAAPVARKILESYFNLNKKPEQTATTEKTNKPIKKTVDKREAKPEDSPASENSNRKVKTEAPKKKVEEQPAAEMLDLEQGEAEEKVEKSSVESETSDKNESGLESAFDPVQRESTVSAGE